MSRNFCGFVDFENQTKPEIVIQMAHKLNINGIYEPLYSRNHKAHMANLYSKSFSAPESTSFMEEISERFMLASFSQLIRLDDLGRKLDINLNLGAISDEEIILRSYLKWNKDIVHHLDGDWAFAIWDKFNQELFLARNPHGDGTLFYYADNNRVFFSSILTGLVNVTGIPNDLDKEKVFMETLTASGFESRTLYKNIHFLKPAHYLSVSRQGKQLNQYWNPLEKPKVNFKHDTEYFEAYFETFDRAVRDRLTGRKNFGFAISGGLDSAATIGIASKYLKKRNEIAHALCFVPTYKNVQEYDTLIKEGDEREFAQATADFNGNIHLDLVTKSEPFWSFMSKYTKDFGVPPHMTGVLFADILAESGHDKGMTHLMIGQGGNQSLTFEGTPSHSSLRQYQNDLSEGLKYNLNLQEFCVLLSKSIVASGKKVFDQASRTRQKRVRKIIDKMTLLSDEFIKSVNGYELFEEHLYGKKSRINEGEFKFRKKLKIGSHCRLGLWNQIGTRYDIVFIDPTRDKYLLELLTSFPNHIFNRKGEQKYLFKQAFKDKIPNKVINYQKKGINLSDLINRYQDDMDNLDALIKSKMNTPLYNELIDPKKLLNFQNALKSKRYDPETFVPELYQKGVSLFHALLT
ncbi:asparagine synthase-related protein [Roseivirga sp.]|uniref:asparagine synthase-related protein n=1 Tax=Roseivirga sp. TaxID=1964215 RepID=UPI003B8BCC9F